MGDSPLLGRGGAGGVRRRGQHGASGAGISASFAAASSGGWRAAAAAAAEEEDSYLVHRKEQIYGVFCDEVEDEVEEEQAARRAVKKSRRERLLHVSGASSSSSEDEDEERGFVDGRSSGESGDEDVPESCTVGRRARSSSTGKKAGKRHYGRHIKFVEGGIWKPDTLQQQQQKKKQKTGEQEEKQTGTSRNAGGAEHRAAGDSTSNGQIKTDGKSSAGPTADGFRAGAGAGGGAGNGRGGAAGVLGDDGEDEEAEEANEAGCMSLRERIMNAQVLKEVLGDAYYDLSSEDDDVKECLAAGGKPQRGTAAVAAPSDAENGREGSSSSSRSISSTVAADERGENGAKADNIRDSAAGDVSRDRAAGAGSHKQLGKAAAAAGVAPRAGEYSSSSSDEDAEEGGSAKEKVTVQQRSFRFSSFSRGNTSTQSGQKTAAGGGGPAQLAKEKNTWGFAKMEKTYGVGFKLLKKMGFKGGGLGRHGTGVANPLEVRIREKNRGLQDSGEKMERKKAGRGKQLTALDILLGARKKEKSAAEEKEVIAEAWKRPAGSAAAGGGTSAAGLSAAERRRRRLGGLSPAEMASLRLKELDQAYRASSSSSASAVRRQGPAVRIIDMTGPEARLIEDESELQQTLQQQKQRAGAAGRRGRKVGGAGGDRTRADRGLGSDVDEGSDGALLSDEESVGGHEDADEEENADAARGRQLPFKQLRQQLESIVRDVEGQLESIARAKKVGEQELLESVDYVPIPGSSSAPSSLFGSIIQGNNYAVNGIGETSRSASGALAAAAAERGGTASSTGEQQTRAAGTGGSAGPSGSGGPSTPPAAAFYEEEVAASVSDACVVADRATALLQRVLALYDQVRESSKRQAAAPAAGADAPSSSADKAAARKQSTKDGPAAGTSQKSSWRCRSSHRSRSRVSPDGGVAEADNRWSGNEKPSGNRSPSVESVRSVEEEESHAGARTSSETRKAEGERAAADGEGIRGSSIGATAAETSCCSVDLDSLVVAAEEWRSMARFEFRLLQIPAVLAAIASLILERRLRQWAPLGGTAASDTRGGSDSGSAKSDAVSDTSTATAVHSEGAGGVTPSSVARLLSFLASLQQHEEAETRAFLTAVTMAEEKAPRASSAAAGGIGCWAAGLLAAAAAVGATGGRGEATGRGATVSKCLQKWQEDEITKIEDEAFGARKRGAAAKRRIRSTLGLFPLRLEGSTGTLRLLQLPVRECAEPYRLGYDVLEKVLQHAVVARLRTAMINDWQPEEEGEEELAAYGSNSVSGTGGLPLDSISCCRCLAVLEKWFAALPLSCVRQLTEEALAPKLLQGVTAWDPSKARVPIHMWLQPWLPYLTREHLQVLSLPLQAKIAAALEEKWQPSDRSAVGLLLPWKNVFDAYSFAALLQRSVMPKLHDHLLNMPVRPDHQRLEPLQDVLAWVPLLPLEMLVNLFLTAFFPRWLQVLRVWLGTPQVDLNEVLEWYAGWKQILPPALLAHPRVQCGALVEALQLMNFASAAVNMQAAAATSGATAASATAARVSPHAPQPPPPPPPSVGPTSALPHVSPVHATPAVSGPAAAVDPVAAAAAAAASASPAYMLHHDLGIGASPYPAPPPTAAPPPPPSPAVAGSHIGASAAYDFVAGAAAAAAAGHAVSGAAVCSPGVAGIKPVEPEQPVSLLDYLEGLAKEKNILFKPKPGRVEEGKQVYAYGRMNMYVKEKLIYVKGKALHTWTAVDVDELLKLAKGEWTKLKETTYERK